MRRTRSIHFQSPQAAHTPIYQQLAEKIETQLLKDDGADGKQLPSIRELSAMFDVNYLTTQHALKYLESRGLISMQVGRGTFATPPNARPLTLGVIVPDLSYKINSAISRSIRVAVNGRNIKPVFMDFHNDPAIEMECLERLQSENINAALIYSSLEEEPQKALLKLVLSGYPLVFVDRAPIDIPCWSISSDDREIGYVAAKHFAECGVTVPACVIAELPNLLDRMRGFQQGLNDAGITLPASRIALTGHSNAVGHCFEMTKEIVKSLMELDPRPDGIFFLNDQHALIGLRQLHDLGIKVPEEVQVMGCDDIEATRHSLPTLTTVKQNAMALGRGAFELICKALDATLDERIRPNHVKVPVELIARESTCINARAVKT
jgi:LacI family transcriptional regulator